MDNTSLRRALWDGSIPCRIELDPAESRAFDATIPYFVRCLLGITRPPMVSDPRQIKLPRLSYIPLYIGGIYRFFEPFLIDSNICKLENAWLEFENVPLKWLYLSPYIFLVLALLAQSVTRIATISLGASFVDAVIYI